MTDSGWDEPKNLKILIIEDNESDRLLISRSLKSITSYSFDVSVAHSLSEAKAFIQQERFHVALIDYLVEADFGTDIIPLLADQNPTCVPILLSGQITPEVHRRALEVGILASLSKDSLSGSQLEATIRQVLHTHRNHRAGTSANDAPSRGAEFPAALENNSNDMLSAGGNDKNLGSAHLPKPVVVNADLDNASSVDFSSKEIAPAAKGQTFNLQTVVLAALREMSLVDSVSDVFLLSQLSTLDMEVRGDADAFCKALSKFFAEIQAALPKGNILMTVFEPSELSNDIILICQELHDLGDISIDATSQHGVMLSAQQLLSVCDASIKFGNVGQDGRVEIVRVSLSKASNSPDINYSSSSSFYKH